MKNTSNYAPPRKGFAHGEKTLDSGTKDYWLRVIQDGNTITQHTFQAESEEQAGSIALSLCSLEKPESSSSMDVSGAHPPIPRKVSYECSRHRGYEIEIEGSIIHLFHIL